MAVINSYTSTVYLQQKGSAVLRLIAPATNAYHHNQHCKYSSDTPVRIIKNPSTTSLKRGTGGRSSFNGIVCTVFGNTGFYGSYVCNRLGKIGTQLILPYRGDHYGSMPLKLAGDLGQVLFHPWHLCDEDSIRKCVKYSNVVINMVGRDWETKNFKFDDVHVIGARRIARICREMGVERFIHVSCLNASPHPEPIFLKNGSQFLKTKWEGEQAVREEFPDATIVRPAVTYGQDDRMFRSISNIWRRHFKGGIPMWEKGEKSIKAPIYVSDVAAGIAEIVIDPNTVGKIYQFLGPKRYYLKDIYMWIHRYIRHYPDEYGYRIMDMKYTPLFKIKVNLANFSVNHPYGYLHWEGLEREHTTDALIPGLPTLEDLGVKSAELANRIQWEIKPFKLEEYYMESIGEFPKPEAPTPVP